MKLKKNKHITIILLSFLVTFSCSTKKKTFNGIAELNCPNHEKTKIEKKKRKTKWRLVLYKDGEKVIGKQKRGKSRLFKNKE